MMFLHHPPRTEAAERLYQRDVATSGYVMNLSRAWAWRPGISESFSALRQELTSESSLSSREIAVIGWATAAARGHAYCALAWGSRLAAEADPATAAGLLAFSTINDALGVAPDAQIARAAPGPVREAVRFGRPVAETAA